MERQAALYLNPDMTNDPRVTPYNRSFLEDERRLQRHVHIQKGSNWLVIREDHPAFPVLSFIVQAMGEEDEYFGVTCMTCHIPRQELEGYLGVTNEEQGAEDGNSRDT